ncbi:MAG: cbb3-type cytochrome c oxidase subunit I, partial [Mycobacteriales bacterium]
MTLTTPPSAAHGDASGQGDHAPAKSKGPGIWGYMTTTDHKNIGVMYLVTSFAFFLLAGILAEIMRAELARPADNFLSPDAYNQLFTMHGTIMMFLFGPPLAFGFANFLVPLQIGAPDVAFPRLNAFAYWLYLFGGLTVIGGFITPGGAASFGWFAYAPLSTKVFSPEVGADMWVLGLVAAGFGTIFGSVNFATTILT